MNIRGYLPTSFIEWPGKIAAVVFVAGCNFRCPFCYNRDLVLNPEKLAEITKKEIWKSLAERQPWIDGVVVTGGEPTLQVDLPAFLKKIKGLGLAARIYTNGSQPAVLEALFKTKLLDAITMDIKGPLDQRYQPAAGAKIDLQKINRSLQLILDSGLEHQLVTTIVPRLHSVDDLVDLAKSLKKLVVRGKKRINWALRQFWPQKSCLDPAFSQVKPYSQNEMAAILAAVQKHLPDTQLTGF